MELLKKSTVQGAQTIQRAVRLLKILAAKSDQGIRLMHAAEAMELERPTTHRLLRALVAEGMAIQGEDTRYRLGPTAFELGLAAAPQFDISELCAPVLRRLAYDTGDTSFLFTVSGLEAVCMARETGSYHIQTPVVSIGNRHPIGVSAGGLAIFCAFSEKKAAYLLNILEKQLSQWELTHSDMWKHYYQTRENGIAVIANRAAPGVKGVGAPILNSSGEPIAAVTIASTISRMNTTRIKNITAMLHQAAKELTPLLCQIIKPALSESGL